MPIFTGDSDRRHFVRIVEFVVDRYRWRCHAYCLMTTHYHLLISTPETNLARGMQQLNGLFAQYFNRRHKVSGHLFQGRYYSVKVESEAHLLELFRYIALNPVRAGRCHTPGRWPWSSYRFSIGLEPPPRFLSLALVEECFGPNSERARAGLRSFVGDLSEATELRAA
jgi:REP element-mobilizing transposase RayT